MKTMWSNIKVLFSARLGRCHQCIRLSVVLALASWFACAVVLWHGASAPLMVVSFVFALGMTGLALAHMGRLALRISRAMEDFEEEVRKQRGRNLNWQRRNFFSVLGKVMAAVVLAPLLRSVVRATAPADPCKNRFTNPDVAKIGPVNVCAKNAADAQAKVEKDAAVAYLILQKTQIFCEQFNPDCAEPKICVPVAKGLTWVCTPKPSVPCPKNLQGFSCEGTFTFIQCDCGSTKQRDLDEKCQGPHTVPHGFLGSIFELFTQFCATDPFDAAQQATKPLDPGIPQKAAEFAGLYCSLFNCQDPAKPCESAGFSFEIDDTVNKGQGGCPAGKQLFAVKVRITNVKCKCGKAT